MKTTKLQVVPLGVLATFLLLGGCEAVPKRTGDEGEGRLYAKRKPAQSEDISLAGPAAEAKPSGRKKSRRGAGDEGEGQIHSKRAADSSEQPSSAAAQRPTAPAGGLYLVDAQLNIDTLDGAAFDPVRGTLSLFGHRSRTDGAADQPYLQLLAAALDARQPQLSLEWTPASQRDVDQALARFSDDRNNDALTTEMAHIFDAQGQLNRRGAGFFRALGVNVWVGMNRYEFNGALLTAAGRPGAGEALRTFGNMIEAIKRNDAEAKRTTVEELARALGLYDFIAENARHFRNGEISETELMDRVWPRIVSGLAQAFGWDDGPYIEKYWRLRRSGMAYDAANDEVLWDIQHDLNRLPRQALDAITATKSEVVVPPEVMRDVLGVEPRVRPVLTGLPDHTRLALTACQADTFCKTLFDQPEVAAKVPRYQGYFAWLRARGEHPVAGDGHLWTSPGNFELMESPDGRVLRFGRTPVVFHIEEYLSGRRSVARPQLSAYADLLTSCYDDIAREYPVMHQLRECMKVVALAHWLQQHGYAVSLPQAGRESVNLPRELPGVIYMVMALQQGPIGEILTAAGGVDYGGDRNWNYAPRDLPAPGSDLVDETGRQVREQMERLLHRKFETPVPHPFAEVTKSEIDGRQVTTVTVAANAPAERGPAPGVQAQRLADEQAVLLWKADDLAGAAKAYRQQIEAAAGDPVLQASLHAQLARVLHQMGDDSSALRELKLAQQLDPQSPIFDLLLAEVAEQSGDLAGAREALLRYLKNDPNNQAAAKILASIEARLKGGSVPAGGRLAMAQAHAQASILNGPDEAAKAADRIIQSDPVIQDLQKNWASSMASRQQLEATLSSLRSQLATTSNPTERQQLESGVAAFQGQITQAEAQAKQLAGEIEKRVKLIKDTQGGPAPTGGRMATAQARAQASVLNGPDEAAKAAEWTPPVNLPPLHLSGVKATDRIIQSDPVIRDLQKNWASSVASQQQLEATLSSLRSQLATTSNPTERKQLESGVTTLQGQSTQTAAQARQLAGEIEKRVKLIIDTQVETATPAPDQASPPPPNPAGTKTP